MSEVRRYQFIEQGDAEYMDQMCNAQIDAEEALTKIRGEL